MGVLMLDNSATQTYAAVATVLLLSLGMYLFYPANLLRWAEKKKYQYEVSSGLYMLTPTEKFIFSQSPPDTVYVQTKLTAACQTRSSFSSSLWSL